MTSVDDITNNLRHDPASLAPATGNPETTLSRRSFVQHAGKALYLAPTLTLLGSATASAQPSCVGITCDVAPDALEAPEAPEASAPPE